MDFRPDGQASIGASEFRIRWEPQGRLVGRDWGRGRCIEAGNLRGVYGSHLPEWYLQKTGPCGTGTRFIDIYSRNFLCYRTSIYGALGPVPPGLEDTLNTLPFDPSFEVRHEKEFEGKEKGFAGRTLE